MLAKHVMNLFVHVYEGRRKFNCVELRTARAGRKEVLTLILQLQRRRNNGLRGGGFTGDKRCAFRQSLGDNARFTKLHKHNHRVRHGAGKFGRAASARRTRGAKSESRNLVLQFNNNCFRGLAPNFRQRLQRGEIFLLNHGRNVGERTLQRAQRLAISNSLDAGQQLKEVTVALRLKPNQARSKA